MAAFKLMPGPKGLPLIGNALTYSRFGKHDFERMHLAKMEYLEKYGTIYRECMGPGVNIVQVFDPKDIEKIFRSDGRLPVRPPLPITITAAKREGLPLGLGSLNGEDWYQLRKSVQRVMMHPRAASVYLPVQNAVADDFLEIIERNIRDGKLLDFEDIILRYTMESIGTVCFDTRLGCLEARSSESDFGIANQMVKATTNIFQAAQKTTFAFPWYVLFRTHNYRQFVNGKKVSNSIALQSILNAQNKCPVMGTPQSTTTEPEEEDPDQGPNFLQTLVNQETLTSQQVTGIVTDLFTAGIDSTANAMCFVLYNLSKHNRAQDILAEEIQRVIPKGQPVTQETFDKMPYMKACVKESFRMNFPIEGGTTRILQKDVTLGGYQVPKGTMVAMNNQTMCIQDQYFSNPGSFLPERWLKGQIQFDKVASPFIMLPFGHGARMCIGRRFAEQEIYLAVIKIFREFKVSHNSSEEVGMVNRIFTVPDRPLELTFEPRTQRSATPCGQDRKHPSTETDISANIAQ